MNDHGVMAGCPAPQAARKPLAAALAAIAGRAAQLDMRPRFPHEDFADLADAGVVALAADRGRCGFTLEIEIVRAVAAASGATSRILDGHFNGVERLALLAEPRLRDRELALVADTAMLLGVWGADPVGDEGVPAHVHRDAGGRLTLRGVKVFCSGAGGVARALVSAREPGGDGRCLAYVDTTTGTNIDRGWFRATGLRASESHRVEFHDAPVLAILGDGDELPREPWLSRDGVRTAATWAGLADQIARAAAEMARSATDESRLLALGEMRVAHATIDRWLDHAAERLGDAERLDVVSARALCAECRIAVARCSQQVAAAALSATGSRALVAGGVLERARRDLDLFVRQHRLEPKLIELGAGAGRHRADANAENRFDALFATDPDPWDYETSPYERAKYEATLEALPPGALGRVLEMGCANGAFTSLLAARCESLLAIDASSAALSLAAARGLPESVELRHATIPEEIPEGTWDVIVCSEVLYYLHPDALVRTLRWLSGQLEAGAVVLAVSWRGHGQQEPVRGDDVHDLLSAELDRWHVLDRRLPCYRLDRFDGAPRA